MLDRILYILFIILLYDLVLNPKGWAIGIPIHFILFLLILILYMVRFLMGDKIHILKPTQIFFLCIIFCCIFYLCFITGLIGYLKGNALPAIYSENNGYLFLLISPVIWYLINHGTKYNSIFTHLTIASGIIAGLSILAFLSNLYYPILFNKITTFVSINNMGVVDSNRIFLKSQIYCMIVSICSLILYLRNTRRQKRLLVALLNMFPIIISLTRAFWVSYLIVFIVYIFVEKKGLFPSLRISNLKKICIMCIIFIGIGLLFTTQPIFNERWHSIFSKDEQGNKVRAYQAEYTIETFKENIFFGAGAGYEYPGVYAWNIESTYYDALAKYGLIGFIVLIIFLSCPLLRLLLFEKKRLSYIDSYVNVYGYLALLLTSATNPFLLASTGMFYISILYGIILSGTDIK